MALLESSLFLAGAEALNTPGLIFFLERIEQNLAAVLRMVHGQADRLRPHVKTHKTREISRLWMALGVKKHKAATLVEAEMLAQEGAEDVLVSYPLVGPAPGALAVLAVLAVCSTATVKGFFNSSFIEAALISTAAGDFLALATDTALFWAVTSAAVVASTTNGIGVTAAGSGTL